MAVYKMMYWRPDAASAPVGVPEEASEANFKTLATRLVTRYCNVHYLIGYNQASLADFREMAEELRKTFPEAKDEDIGCSAPSYRRATTPAGSKSIPEKWNTTGPDL